MFDTEAWMASPYPANNARALFSAILTPKLWEMGEAEADALDLAQSRCQPLESYWLYQPYLGTILW